MFGKGFTGFAPIFSFILAMLCTSKVLNAFKLVAPLKQINKTQFRMSSVLNMPAKELSKILKDSNLRSQYQIVDVRELDELRMVSLPDKDVMHLPLSESNVWTEEIIEGKSSLDKDKATICMCHHGMRSKRMADFLVSEAKFEEVYNLVGGIHAYAIDVDPSVGTY